MKAYMMTSSTLIVTDGTEQEAIDFWESEVGRTYNHTEPSKHGFPKECDTSSKYTNEKFIITGDIVFYENLNQYVEVACKGFKKPFMLG